MYTLSKRSLDRVDGCNPRIITLIKLAISRTPIDFGVAWMGGKRTAEEQNKLYLEGNSKCDGYKILSKHQSGNAVDLNVFVNSTLVDNKEMLCVIAGVMFSCASELGFEIRWGLDWDQDGDIRDNKFNDMYHFEIVE
jgi:peptidoglycan L-alanyl-D-glutamate endopeptidase CwlK